MKVRDIKLLMMSYDKIKIWDSENESCIFKGYFIDLDEKYLDKEVNQIFTFKHDEKITISINE